MSVERKPALATCDYFRYMCPHPAICVSSGEDSGAGGSVSVEWEPALATSDYALYGPAMTFAGTYWCGSY